MSLKPKSIQIEKVPEMDDTETWATFNKRLNDLVNQGYIIAHVTDTYIILRKEPAEIRR